MTTNNINADNHPEYNERMQERFAISEKLDNEHKQRMNEMYKIRIASLRGFIYGLVVGIIIVLLYSH